jgi:hypothetical protein
MTTSESFRALRRANPRAKDGFAQSVEAAAGSVRDQLAAAGNARPAPHIRQPRRRWRRVGISAAGAALLTAAAVAAVMTIGSPTGGPGVENATAAIRTAATVTAASAERSGTAVVRITRNGRVWSGTTIRWNGEDMSTKSDVPGRNGKAGSALLLVDGMLYGVDGVDGGWVVMGPPASIDPDSGTTPAEYLAAVREDVGGVTLRRIAEGLTALTTSPLDGATVYSGRVTAGRIARETGFKEGRSIRVFPFGYVAHDEAADPAALLDTALTVGADGVIRKIAVTWGTRTTWTYTVTYSKLGATEAPVAPANPRPLRDRWPVRPPKQ